jgi:hypothetical protein
MISLTKNRNNKGDSGCLCLNSWRPVNDHFFYDNMELQILDSYVYLGMLFHYNGTFLQIEKRLLQHGARLS